MNKDIQTLIEREAKKEYEEYLHGTSDIKEFLDMDDLLPLSDALKACEIATNAAINTVLSIFKWRNFTSELPCIGQRIICIGRKGNFHLSNPISHDGIHWLSENFIEWMPIPQID